MVFLRLLLLLLFNETGDRLMQIWFCVHEISALINYFYSLFLFYFLGTCSRSTQSSRFCNQYNKEINK